MQPQATHQFYLQQSTPMYAQDGSSTAHTWVPDKSQQQFPQPWENNGTFHMNANNTMGSGPGQNRQVGPQQPPPPSQPPPTSTPPGLHPDIPKAQVLANQQAQLSYVQTRPLAQQFNAGFARQSLPQQPMRHRPTAMVSNWPIQGVLTSPGPIVHYPAPVMFSQQRPGTPYPNQPYMAVQPQQYYHPPHANTQYFPQVLPQNYQTMGAGGAPSGQQGSVPLIRTSHVATAPPSNPIKHEPHRKTRHFAIPIINPCTGEQIDTDSGTNNNNITPSHSNDSSARETPQPMPNSGSVVDNNVAADFAAKVAQAIATETMPEPQPEVPECNEGDLLHKQPLNSLSIISKEFVPRSLMNVPAPTPVVLAPGTPTPLIPTPVNPVVPALPVVTPASVIPSLPVPTVSAETSSPAVDIQSPARINKRQIAPPTPTVTAPVSAPVESNKNLNRPESVPVPKERRDKRSLSKEQSPVPVPSSLEINIEREQVTVEALPTHPSAALTKVTQHHNGISADVPVSHIESNKTSGKGKNKKGKSMMRELNRKVVDKEGSDMDAFTTEPNSIVVEEPASPAPLPPTPAIVAAPLSTPAPVPEPAPTPRPPSPMNKIQEDLLEKEVKPIEQGEEAKMVAAKNLENSISKPEEEKPTPQLTLKLSYKEDQWSPLNLEGKKKYDRDFLLELKDQPQSNQKPDNLPDVVAVIRDSSNNMRNQSMNFMTNRDIQGILPAYAQRNSQNLRGLVSKRGSQQGTKGRNPKVIHVTLALHDDVKLKTDENAWKPHRRDTEVDKSDSAKQTEELYKTVRGILNKLTPEKFDKLMNKFRLLKIDSEEKLLGVISLIFDKAVDEPNFSKCYANMCKICSKLEVSKVENGADKVNFRKILITRCQNEFEKCKPAELDLAKHLEEIQNCTNPEQKKELQLVFEEKERAIRMKSVGNIRFIGELFKLGMLTPTIMHRCIEHLLKTLEEESLECLCKLLTTIGKELELSQVGSCSGSSKSPQIQSLNPYFERMSEISRKKEGSKVSSRVRFMLQDVIELRQNKWVPRREDNNPKTIDQIYKEVESENIMEKVAFNSNQPPRLNNRPSDRQDDRGKRSNRGNNNNAGEDGWVSVGPSKHYHNKTLISAGFEASKLQNVKSDDLNSLNVSLGSGSQFRFRNTDNKPTFTSSNTFSALSHGDERKPPQSNINNNRRIITPTASIERNRDRERQRMMQGVQSEGHSSRGSSVQRGPPSRDNSVPPPATTPSDTPTVAKTAPVGREKLEWQTSMIIDEFRTGVLTIELVKQEVEQLYSIGEFIEKALQLALERKTETQQSVGHLLAGLINLGVITPENIVEQLQFIYECADDIAIDVPKVWEIQAKILVPILVAGKINYSHIKAACSPVLKTDTAKKLLVPTFTLLAQEKGPAFVRKLWDSSNVDLNEFLPNNFTVDAFIKENSLDYLTGEAPKFDGNSSKLSPEQVQSKMLCLMQQSQSYEQIIDFISNNVGDKVGDLQFIRALITSICEACITGSNLVFDNNKLNQYKKLIQRFVDNKEDRELAAINAVHLLVSRLEYPQGLILSIFNSFLDDNLISSDSFLKWRDDKENVEQKGVSLYALTSFFSVLKESESDEETS